MITFVSNNDEPKWHGYLYALALFVIAITETILMEYYFHVAFKMGIRVFSALSGAVYRKVSPNPENLFIFGSILG